MHSGIYKEAIGWAWDGTKYSLNDGGESDINLGSKIHGVCFFKTKESLGPNLTDLVI